MSGRPDPHAWLALDEDERIELVVSPQVAADRGRRENSHDGSGLVVDALNENGRMKNARWASEEIIGTWHLLDARTDEVHLPDHRMDLRFKQGKRLDGVVLSRVTGEEMPIIYDLSFDGQTLRLQLVAPRDHSQDEMPFLLMNVVNKKLVGHWEHRGVLIGPELQLVRGHGV